MAAVVDAARPAIERRIASSPAGEKPAIVLEKKKLVAGDGLTLVLDLPDARHREGPRPDPVRPRARRGDLLRPARPGIVYSMTERNLKSVGYPVSGLYVRDLPALFEQVSAYKTAKRAEIEARGYTIIANIGNNESDLVGGHAERTVKLPDYGGKLS
ncbi:conserved hypothetical protein [Streptomyces sp. C]|nr:conserved hypothetical protein [Streptomyces sp. C]